MRQYEIKTLYLLPSEAHIENKDIDLSLFLSSASVIFPAATTIPSSKNLLLSIFHKKKQESKQTDTVLYLALDSTRIDSTQRRDRDRALEQ